MIAFESHYKVVPPSCTVYVSVKDKLFHTTNENSKLAQDVTYLTSRLERIIVSEKIIENDLSRVEECYSRSIYKLGLGFERCEQKC